MSLMKAALSGAAPRTRDVRVVLNGDLAAERAELLDALNKAAIMAKRDERLAQAVTEPSRAALDEWDEAHHGDVLTVRLVQQPHAVWRLLQRKHPAPKNPSQRDLFDNRHGFGVIPAVTEFLEKHALIVDGDIEEQPDAEEWNDFFKTVAPGDMYQLCAATLDLHNETSEQAFGDLVKA